MGFQYTPVASMATVVTPRSASHSASAATWAVVVPKRRLWAATSAPCRSCAQATTESLWTSRPATRSRIAFTVPPLGRARTARGGKR